MRILFVFTASLKKAENRLEKEGCENDKDTSNIREQKPKERERCVGCAAYFLS